jgi:hypothetical protein
MWAHLWTKSENAPESYISLVLCRDVYHCPPDVLERQNLIKVFQHIRIMNVEYEVEQLRNPKKGKRNAKLPT